MIYYKLNWPSFKSWGIPRLWASYSQQKLQKTINWRREDREKTEEEGVETEERNSISERDENFKKGKRLYHPRAIEKKKKEGGEMKDIFLSALMCTRDLLFTKKSN